MSTSKQLNFELLLLEEETLHRSPLPGGKDA